MDLIWRILSNRRLRKKMFGFRKRISIPANTDLCEMPYEFYTDRERPYREQYLREISNITRRSLRQL